MAHYGQSRMIGDLDVLSLQRFCDGVFTSPNGVMIDPKPPTEPYVELLTDAVTSGHLFGKYLRIVTLPHLLAIKFVAPSLYRNPSKQEPRPEDLADLEWLASNCQSARAPAQDLLRQWVGPAAADDFGRTVMRA